MWRRRAPRLARRRRARPGRDAGGLVARAGLRRPRRRRARRAPASSPRSVPSRTRPGAVLPHERTHRGPDRGPARAPAGDPDPARADLPPLRGRAAARAPGARARPRGRTARGSGGSRAIRVSRPLRRPAAPDRGRAPSLRDGGRVRAEDGADRHARRPRLDGRPGSRDLPDPPGVLQPAGHRPRRRGARETSRSALEALAAEPPAEPPPCSSVATGRGLVRGDGGRARRGAGRPASATRASRTRRTATRRSAGRETARPTRALPRARRSVSRTSSRARGRGRRCPRRRRTSSRSSCRGSCSTPSTRDGLARVCRAAVADLEEVLARAADAASSASRCCAPARAATTRPRSTRRPRTPSCGASRRSATDLTLVSEELGVRAFGAGGGPTVVVDPIDGSVNAKRGIPFFSLSLAVADGPTMDDVVFGYVYDFGAREEWVGGAGRGALLDGVAARRARPEGRRSRSSSLEGTTTDAIAAVVAGDARCRPPAARHGLARALALPPRRRAVSTPSAASSRHGRSTSRPRSSSSASGATRSTCSRTRRSAPRRSTSASARGSSPRRRTTCARTIAAALR